MISSPRRDLPAEVFPDGEILFLHAHPDDEAFLTAGVLLELDATGRRCTVVYLAAGQLTSAPATFRRQAEAHQACAALEVAELHFLGFHDSCYDDHPGAVSLGTSPDEAVLAALTMVTGQLGRYSAIVGYDRNGGYGHRDHRRVHEIARSAARESSIPLLEATIDRDVVTRWLASARSGEELRPDLGFWSPSFGLPGSLVDCRYELSAEQLVRKREALACHASQMNPGQFPLGLERERFASLLGVESLHVPKEMP
ncbi:PIG-L family deacetylase [Kribbella sancticallisti]|uniref:PIG-L family deacetylase n=1 Tax=Kribbella sancticallisti TaxID=460087 RepID=A0ABP4QPW3_9ACTN